jgi:hypothetical protein
MGVSAQKFEGIETAVPGVYTKSEFPPGTGASGVSLNTVAIIGPCLGGIPYNATGLEDSEKVNVVTSTAQALDLLQGEEGYYMTEFYLSPTKDPNLSLPTRALVFNVRQLVQADAEIESTGPVTTIELTAVRYGTLGNQLARKIEAATTLGHKVTVKFRGETIAEKDDVALEYFEIQYTGAGTAATMNITATQLDTTVTGGAGGEDLVMTFAEFPRVGDIVNFINEQDGYTCSLLTKSNADATTFDLVTAQDIKTSTYTAVALVEALIQFFNNDSGGEIVANLKASADRDDVLNDTGFVFFTGGSAGSAPTITDWTTTLDLMTKFKINHILVATGDPATHAAASTHVNDMSNILNKQYRTASSGASDTTKTILERIAECKALNDARFEYNFTPIKRFDAVNNNVLTTFAPFYGAALLAGIKYGNDVTISATFKSINILGVGETYDIPEMDSIIQGGGSLLKYEDGGEVVHNVTTYQGSNLILNLPSMLRTSDAVTLDSQDRILARLKAMNKAPTDLVINEFENYLITNILADYRDNKGWLVNEVQNGQVTTPAYTDVEFVLSGDRFDFSFTGLIPAPLHYGFIKQKFVVPGLIQ